MAAEEDSRLEAQSELGAMLEQQLQSKAGAQLQSFAMSEEKQKLDAEVQAVLAVNQKADQQIDMLMQEGAGA